MELGVSKFSVTPGQAKKPTLLFIEVRNNGEAGKIKESISTWQKTWTDSKPTIVLVPATAEIEQQLQHYYGAANASENVLVSAASHMSNFGTVLQNALNLPSMNTQAAAVANASADIRFIASSSDWTTPEAITVNGQTINFPPVRVYIADWFKNILGDMGQKPMSQIFQTLREALRAVDQAA